MEWTNTDVYILRQELARGKSLEDIGKQLNRSMSSVYEKVKALKIKLVGRNNYPCVINNKLSEDIRREINEARLVWDTTPLFKPQYW
jgi:DNA-binding NarL/FixJ family response regulator